MAALQHGCVIYAEVLANANLLLPPSPALTLVGAVVIFRTHLGATWQSHLLNGLSPSPLANHSDNNSPRNHLEPRETFGANYLAYIT